MFWLKKVLDLFCPGVLINLLSENNMPIWLKYIEHIFSKLSV